jgi:crossover junction endodeoxyribonuclease RusA
MTSITILLPLPVRKLSPNARVHWAEKAKLVKASRRVASIASLEALNLRRPPGWLKAKMEVKAYFKTLTFPDPDNFIASLKSSIDGIADSGIILDDKALWPERPVFKKDAENPRIEIKIGRAHV